jgi:hypothetical protein
MRRRPETPLVIRLATQADQVPLTRLAQLDSAPPLEGRVVLVEADGRIRVALALADGRAIADPFFRTAEILDLLETRAAQLRVPNLSAQVRPVARLFGWPRATRSIASRSASRPDSAAA